MVYTFVEAPTALRAVQLPNGELMESEHVTYTPGISSKYLIMEFPPPVLINDEQGARARMANLIGERVATFMTPDITNTELDKKIFVINADTTDDEIKEAMASFETKKGKVPAIHLDLESNTVTGEAIWLILGLMDGETHLIHIVSFSEKAQSEPVDGPWWYYIPKVYKQAIEGTLWFGQGIAKDVVGVQMDFELFDIGDLANTVVNMPGFPFKNYDDPSKLKSGLGYVAELIYGVLFKPLHHHHGNVSKSKLAKHMQMYPQPYKHKGPDGIKWPLWKLVQTLYLWGYHTYEQQIAYCRNDAVTGWTVIHMFAMHLVTSNAEFEVPPDADLNAIMAKAIRFAVASPIHGTPRSMQQRVGELEQKVKTDLDLNHMDATKDGDGTHKVVNRSVLPVKGKDPTPFWTALKIAAEKTEKSRRHEEEDAKKITISACLERNLPLAQPKRP